MAISIPSSPPPPLMGATSIERPQRLRGFAQVRIPAKDLLFFTSQLSVMVEVGTSLTDAISAMAVQTRHAGFRGVMQDMVRQLEEGRQLSDIMCGYPRIFEGAYVSMVRAAEEGGYLKDTLSRIVELQERREAMIGQIRNSLTYPAILCVLAVGVVIFILVGVLPRFTAFFAGKESLLPWPTKFLMALSAGVQSYWWAILIGSVLLSVGFASFRRSPAGQAFLDTLCVHAPGLRGVYRKIHTCQILRTLGQLLHSQVPLLEALDMTRRAVSNVRYQRLVMTISKHVEQGGRLSHAILHTPYLTPSIQQMLATGEAAGRLSPVMLRLATYHEKELERDLKRVSALIEPCTLIVMGSIVGLIVASVVLPLFRMAHAIH